MTQNDLFRTLLFLLPESPGKRSYDNADLVSELIIFIRKLEHRKEELRKKRDGLLLARDNACAIQLHETKDAILDDEAVDHSSFSDAESHSTSSSAYSSWSCTAQSGAIQAASSDQPQCFDDRLVIDFSGTDVSITVRSSKKPDTSLFLRIITTLMNVHHLKTIQADVSARDDSTFYLLHAQVVDDGGKFSIEALRSVLQESVVEQL